MSGNVFFEAVVRGYLRDDPAALALVQGWIREERPERPEPRPRPQTDREIDEIYAAIDGGMMMTEEDEDAHDE